ncbi:MAG: hypothetical protein JXQ73_21365 [Phycisphaerae bacterium]|nr:hypothetical protein [Phycisphaerae bacterium]
MRLLTAYTFGFALSTACVMTTLAGEASTNAWAQNTGSAGATANWDGDGGKGIARTDTRTGKINLARGLAVGIDRDGLDLSFSHAIAPQRGPAYAGTFNLSIGRDGSVSHSYGGAIAQGGSTRSVEATGATSSRWNGTALASAGGNTTRGGTVQARTYSRNDRAQPYQGRPVVRLIKRLRNR